jgi:hypothetical protein
VADLSLHPDWQNIIKYAWSVRLMALSAVLSGVVAGLTMAQPYLNVSPILIAVAVAVLTTAAALISILGICARVVKQQGID